MDKPKEKDMSLDKKKKGDKPNVPEVQEKEGDTLLDKAKKEGPVGNKIKQIINEM